jgi:cyclopropane-fatty-acyl-phospholipid synthase
VWAVSVRPSDVDGGASAPAVAGASVDAVRAHYDLSNDFYRLVLGPTMMYSSGRWPDGRDRPLEAAQDLKIDRFVEWTDVTRDATVLDVGSGWGYTLRRLVGHHGVHRAVGLTPSASQHEHGVSNAVAGVEHRLERWEDHAPARPYDAIFSFGAFEHFAPDGSLGPERIAAYRRFFSRCYSWLEPGGRIGLETIGHDDAPDTDAPRGRGPLGDVVLGVYPESVCPHLSEVVLGFEPWFEVLVLESAAADFARTMQWWTRNLRANEMAAAALVGTEMARTFRRYLIASDVQFRLNAVTNYRIVLRRRPAPRR